MEESPNMSFGAKSYRSIITREGGIILSSYFKACDFLDVVGEEPSDGLPRRI